jgi:pimeloyl-ACP methyl ester carboxylesterase
MADVIFNDAKIYYEVKGQYGKTPLVLLHGFLEDSQIWNEIVVELKEERQIICIDLPGHGNSDPVLAGNSMEAQAYMVREVLKKEGVEKVSIAGHSMGGYVGLEFLKNFPKMLQSIVLINSTPVQDSEERKKVRDRSIALVGKNKKAYISMAISNLFTENSRKRFQKEIEELKNRALKMSPEVVQATLKSMKNRTNLEDELKKFNKQKFMIAAKDDPILDILSLREISNSTECDFFSLKNGHNSWLEDRNSLTKIMQLIE